MAAIAQLSECCQKILISSAISHAHHLAFLFLRDDCSISGLVAEYIVAIDVTQVRFPADAFNLNRSVPTMP